jgi:transposase InsO family protein
VLVEDFLKKGTIELLDVRVLIGFDFVSLEDAQARIEHWRQDYNHHRPHGALGKLTPSEFARRGQTIASNMA